MLSNESVFEISPAVTKKQTTLSSYLLEARGRTGPLALQYKEGRSWKKLSWKDYTSDIFAVASALLDQSVKVGDRVAIFSSTRHEWAICDLATIAIRAVTVPIYHTMTAEELEFILNNSQAKTIFVENKELLKLFQMVAPRCTWIENVILMEGRESGTESWNALIASGRSSLGKAESEIKKKIQSANQDDLVTIVYTSGTTGVPKGVMLTHQQVLSEVCEAYNYVGAETDDVSLSFLPYSHILGRIEVWGHLIIGFTMAFAESIEKIPQNLKEIRPTIMIAVPRIFEKVYVKILAKIDSNLIQRKLFAWALTVGKKVGNLRLAHEPVPFHLIPEYELANRFLLTNVREAFGGRLRFAISGGAPLNKDIGLFFHACGILILEGYGLTETTGAVTVNTPFDYNFGTVGKPIGEVQIKFAEDGEILIKSQKVMTGYYEDPEATKKVTSDGWFATGDIGEFTSTGALRITDRKKDLIKTAGGKYIAPQKIEGLLKTSGLISHVHIHGDQRKYVVALITLDPPSLIAFAKQRGISFPSFGALTQHQVIAETIRKTVAEANAHLASFETIKRFLILREEVTIETGELTPSLKVKRKAVDTKYKKELDSLYS